MHEHQQPNHESPRQAGDEPWDPDEQAGEVHEAEVDSQGRVEHAHRLSVDGDDEQSLGNEQPPAAHPRIWVGSWLDYHHGVQHGQWIDADREEADVRADIQAMLARSPTSTQTGEAAEAWGILGHEHFGDLRIDEQESLGWVTKVARGISERGTAFAVWAGVVEDETLLDGFQTAYLGRYDSVEAYARQLADELAFQQLVERAVPERLRPYVRLDTAKLARDLQFGGELYVLPADEGGVWLFKAGD